MWGSGTHTNLGEFRSTAPVARPLSDFATEHVGDDLVVFDAETMQYHTLNGVAATIWHACDGVSTIEAIAVSAGLPAEVVETTVAELGEASLLQSPASTWSVSMNRRRAAKLIAAGAVGAVGVPVVLSITAPSHQAAATDEPTCAEFEAQCSSSQIGQQLPNCANLPETLICCDTAPFWNYGIWWYVLGQQDKDWNCGPTGASFRGANGGFEEPVTDDSIFTASIEDDPYLGDEDGNVDVNAIQTDSVEQAVESDDVPATDVLVENVDSAPVDDMSGSDVSTNSSGGETESVDTSSSAEEAPTDETGN